MVKVGLSVLQEKHLDRLRKHRLGVLCHDASVDEDFRHIIDILVSEGINVVKIFAPEHGLYSQQQDQVAIREKVHPKYGIPVVSLYGDSFVDLAPKEKDLDDIDIILIDLQDVGARYYTFVWSAAIVFQKARKFGVDVCVLDRPNPIGAKVEGPIQEENYLSFVGLYPMPIRHGLTIGEVLMWVANNLNVAPPSIIRMENWRREMLWSDTGLWWVAPSPNMPTPNTALVYPGMCLLEGTNISEGRGTTRPFELFGAPWIDSYKLAARICSLNLPGVVFRPTYFVPQFNKYSRQLCGGIQIHVVDAVRYEPVIVGFSVIKTVMELFPSDFSFSEPPYEFEGNKLPFDILTGSSKWRKIISDVPVSCLRDMWKEDEEKWREEIRPLLTYN